MENREAAYFYYLQIFLILSFVFIRNYWFYFPCGNSHFAEKQREKISSVFLVFFNKLWYWAFVFSNPNLRWPYLRRHYCGKTFRATLSPLRMHFVPQKDRAFVTWLLLPECQVGPICNQKPRVNTDLLMLWSCLSFGNSWNVIGSVLFLVFCFFFFPKVQRLLGFPGGPAFFYLPSVPPISCLRWSGLWKYCPSMVLDIWKWFRLYSVFLNTVKWAAVMCQVGKHNLALHFLFFNSLFLQAIQ